jgi:hypothetical protein
MIKKQNKTNPRLAEFQDKLHTVQLAELFKGVLAQGHHAPLVPMTKSYS